MRISVASFALILACLFSLAWARSLKTTDLVSIAGPLHRIPILYLWICTKPNAILIGRTDCDKPVATAPVGYISEHVSNTFTLGAKPDTPWKSQFGDFGYASDLEENAAKDGFAYMNLVCVPFYSIVPFLVLVGAITLLWPRSRSERDSAATIGAVPD